MTAAKTSGGPEQRGRIAGAGVELAYGFWPGAGRPLVGIHGLTAHHLFFLGVAERLAGRRPLFAPDLRGRGDSDKPSPSSGLDTHAADVAAAMRAYGLGRSIIVGHSMGANTAIALAANSPDLVEGLVLLDGGYTAEFGPGITVQALELYLLQPILTRLARVYPSREAAKQAWLSDGHFATGEWNPWLDAYVDYGLGGSAPAFKEKASPEAARDDFGELTQRERLNARIQKVHAPTLLLRATAGFLPVNPPGLPDAAVTQFKRLMPQLEERAVPGTTHYSIALTEPGASIVTDAIVEFAAKLGA
jgi:pimeloyl-ACP methyl ester carboxylesterase